jgi:nitrogen-specific signal transduction histidine kinase
MDEVLAEIAEASHELEATTSLLRDRTRELLTVETLLSAVLDEVDDLVVVVDADVVVNAMSAAAERWLDVAASKAMGRRLGELVQDEDALALVRATRAVAEGADGEAGREVTVAGRAFRIRPIRSHGGAIVIAPRES